MTIFFSPNTGGFYDDLVNSFIPDDAYEFDVEERDALLSQVSHGRHISVENGAPVIIEPVVDVLALIAAERYRRETTGITINGLLIDTSDRSKTLINGSALKALRNPDFVLRWKTADGFIELTADQVLAIADAVSDYVQACFDREEALQKAYADGTYTAAMLDEGWPA
jgi:hypothetical protein